MVVQVGLLPEHPRKCGGCAHIVRLPEHLRICNANRACVLVLVQSPVASDGELKAKPIWVCLVLAEAIKGKVQVAAISGVGSIWHTAGYLPGGSGAVCPHQCISQSSSDHKFAVLQGP